MSRQKIKGTDFSDWTLCLNREAKVKIKLFHNTNIALMRKKALGINADTEKR